MLSMALTGTLVRTAGTEFGGEGEWFLLFEWRFGIGVSDGGEKGGFGYRAV